MSQRDPGPEEPAAIVAAVEALWPRPTIVIVEPAKRPSPWRFSGRWWNKPVPLSRTRPWARG